MDGLERQLATRLSLRAREHELVALLRRTPLFARVGQPLVRWLVVSSTLAWFRAGSEVCRKGDEGDAMFRRGDLPAWLAFGIGGIWPLALPSRRRSASASAS